MLSNAVVGSSGAGGMRRFEGSAPESDFVVVDTVYDD
jgi:hypothetical protein